MKLQEKQKKKTEQILFLIKIAILELFSLFIKIILK